MDPITFTTITEAAGTAMSGIQTNVLSFIAAAVPVALGIAGTFIAVKLGVRFFKSVAK